MRSLGLRHAHNDRSDVVAALADFRKRRRRRRRVRRAHAVVRAHKAVAVDLGLDAGHELGVDRAGLDEAHVEPEALGHGRERLVQPLDGEFRGAVAVVERLPDDAANRRDRDESPGALLPHVR
eukprot:Amastigsp_a2760_116.p3 type:complete len:123 gc:universal Amastigsp_a2760_116:147-515(+)